MKKRNIALIALMCCCTIFLTSCSRVFTVFPTDKKEGEELTVDKNGDVIYPEQQDNLQDYTTEYSSAKKPNSSKTYTQTEYGYSYGIKSEDGKIIALNTVDFSKLGLERPNVIYPAEVIFGTYQNMDQLAYNPNGWTFCRTYGDGVIIHEAYWLNESSPQTTEGKALGDILATADNLKVYLEYGFPKRDIDASASDDGTAYGLANAERAKYKINRFMQNTGIDIDVINIEYYSGAVTEILGKLGLAKNWENHYSVGVPFLLKTYDTFYNQFINDFPGMKINHVGCPNLTGWVRESEGGTLPRYWQQNYNQPYWTSYQAYDITIPIFEKYGKDGLHIGWVHDSSWNSFDKGQHNIYGTQDAVVLESMNIIQNRFGLNSTLIVGSWEGGSGNTVATGGALLNETHEVADKYFWENCLKSIYNAQYYGEYHNAYLLESYWDGPYKMVPETDKYSYTNLVMTAIKYLKGIGQDLDLYITDEAGKVTGEGIYAETPSTEQSVNSEGNTKTYQVTLKNNGEVDCNPWLRAVENKNGAKVSYYYKGQDITDAITSDDGFTFKDLFEDADGNFDLYTSEDDPAAVTHYDEQNHGLKSGETVTIEVKVSGGDDGAVAICGFYNMQDMTNTIKDVVTIEF